MTDEQFVKKAIEEARKSQAAGGPPLGAVIVKNGDVLASGRSLVWTNKDPSAHPEIECMKAACQKLGTLDLSGCCVYSTLESCSMCLGCASWSGLSRIVFGAFKEDAPENSYELGGYHAVEHAKILTPFGGGTIEVVGGVLRDEENEDELICIGFSTVPVFAASDTEGKEFIPGYQPQELPPLLEVAKKFNISVDYVPVPSDRLGDTNREGSKIRLGSQNPSVFFHELTHAIHAHIEGGLKGGQHQDQETIAEFTAAVLMDFYGYGDHSGNAWKYISHYAKDPLTAITKALGTVERVLEVLLSG